MKKDFRSEEFRKLVVLGPSITAGGWSTCRERCWASVLAGLINDFQSVPLELLNMGIGANVISKRSPCSSLASKPAGLERLDRHVIAHRPDLVIIGEFAVCDARGGTPIDLYRQELTTMIHRLRRAIDPVIVVLGPTYIIDYTLGGSTWSHATPQIFRQYNQMIAKTAAETGCLYADVLAAMDETDWMVHYDGVHVNDLGHRIIAHEIFKVLAGNCSCLAKRTRELEKTSPRWRDESTLKESEE